MIGQGIELEITALLWGLPLIDHLIIGDGKKQTAKGKTNWEAKCNDQKQFNRRHLEIPLSFEIFKISIEGIVLYSAFLIAAMVKITMTTITLCKRYSPNEMPITSRWSESVWTMLRPFRDVAKYRPREHEVIQHPA